MLRLPRANGAEPIDKVIVNEHFTFGTTRGIKKLTRSGKRLENEDAIGYVYATHEEDELRICVADAHNGPAAAQGLTDGWLAGGRIFPSSETEARSMTRAILRSAARNAHGTYPETYWQSHAAFVAIQIGKQAVMRVVSYGDCRAWLVRDKQIIWQLQTYPDWIGLPQIGAPESDQSLSALMYEEVPWQPGDTLATFTDGLDECIYARPTIEDAHIADVVSSLSASAAFDRMMQEVFDYGAEDNASLAVIKLPVLSP